MKDQRVAPYHPDKNMLQAAAIYVEPETFTKAYQAALDVAPAPTAIGQGALTLRQKDVLAYIFEWFKDHSTAPTFEEIGRGLGMEKSAVHDHVHELKRKKYITMTRKKRSIKITETAYSMRKI